MQRSSVWPGLLVLIAACATSQTPTKPPPPKESKAAAMVREADAFAAKAEAELAATTAGRNAAARATAEAAARRKIAARYAPLLAVEAPAADEPALEDRFFRAVALDPGNAAHPKAFRRVLEDAVKKRRHERAGRLLARAEDVDAAGAAAGVYAAAEELVAREGCLLFKAPDHDLRAYVSLPKGWSAATAWPVLIVVDGAGSHFAGACATFRTLRRDLPYVLIAPCTLSNTNDLDPARYPHYAPELLAKYAEKSARFAFDEPGLDAVLKRVRSRFKTEERFFMTGFSGGGLLTYRLLLTRPESFRGAAPACANFHGALADGAVDAASGGPPVRILTGEKDEHRELVLGKYKPGIDGQSDLAEAALRESGFTRVSRVMLPGTGHSSCAQEVFAFIESVRAAK